MKTLKLFNAVLSKESNESPFISEQGFIIMPDALWAKDRIIEYYTKESLNGNDLNKTFHKSWKKIKDSSRIDLFIHQVIHYMSTYGTNFEGEVYIPKENLDIPELKEGVTFKVIKGYTKDEFIEKSLNILRSGIALKEDTIDELISLLVDEFEYSFTGKENIKNKEAIIKIGELYGVYPDNPVEFFRLMVYKSTGQSLLIKSPDVIAAIKASKFNPSIAMKKFGLERLAEIFNRFKPLFLAFKSRSPKTINKISKLSKTKHKPLKENPLNKVTSVELADSDVHWLDNATVYALFKAISACYARIKGQDSFVYRIRNGKSWVKESTNKPVNTKNYKFLLEYLKSRFDFSGKKIFIPEDIKYALPTSEKMFVGNIPTGTRFYGKKLAVGIYWENAWGAHDLDLSGLNIGGKVGWNASYNSDGLYYSGDLTDARNGAVEYLYANKGLDTPTLVQNSVFSGDADCKYKIIVDRGDKVSKNYMMDPNNLFAEVLCQSIQKQTILGMLIPKDDKQCFVLLNFGAGHARVSGNSPVSMMATKALYQQWNKPLSFNKMMKYLGAEMVDNPEESDINLSLEYLEKDSFTKIFDSYEQEKRKQGTKNSDNR